MSRYSSRNRRCPPTRNSTSAATQPPPIGTYLLNRVSDVLLVSCCKGVSSRTNRSRSLSTQNCPERRSPAFAPTTQTGRPSQVASLSTARSNPRRSRSGTVRSVGWAYTSKPSTSSGCTNGRAMTVASAWNTYCESPAKIMPLPESGGSNSIRSFPGVPTHSCQTVWASVPSAWRSVLYWVKVRVRYHVPSYRARIAWSSCRGVEIGEGDGPCNKARTARKPVCTMLSPGWVRLAFQPVAGLAHRQNALGVRGIGLELTPQLRDVRVHRAAHDLRAVPPDLGQQLHAGGAGAVAAQQRKEQIVFLRCQGHGSPAADHGARRGDHLDVPEPLDRRRRRAAVAPWRRAPEQRLDAGQQLEHAERLGHVVVGAEPQTAHLVGLLAAGRQDQHRHAVAALPQGAQHSEPVQPREHQVEDHEIGLARPRAGEPLGAVARDLHVVALDLEVVAQPVGEIGIVFDDQDALGAHAAPPAPAGATGSSITKRAPPASGGASSTQARPLCSVASSRTTARPMPLPATAVPRSRSRRQNRSHTRSRSECGMPGPQSSTHSRGAPLCAPAPPRPAPTITVWPGGPYFTALSRRLRSI